MHPVQRSTPSKEHVLDYKEDHPNQFKDNQKLWNKKEHPP